MTNGTAPASPGVLATTNRRAVAALFVLAFAAFCFVTTEMLPSGMLPFIAKGLRISDSRAGLVVTAYATAVLLSALPLTFITRRVPRRLLLSSALALFALSTFLAAEANSFAELVAARVVSGLTQGVFWSVVASTATGLFRLEVRGRMVARLSLGNALAPVLGVPLGTFLADQDSWRAPLEVMAVLGGVACAGVALVVPSVVPEHGGAARGTQPDTRRFATLLVVTAVSVMGAMCWFTYMTTYLERAASVPAAELGLLLSTSGLASVIGTALVGKHLDLRPVGSLLSLLASSSVGLMLLFLLPHEIEVVVAMVAVMGASFSCLAAAIQHRVMQLAPGSTDVGSACMSSAFNVGIALGSLVGSSLVSAAGPRYVPLFGGVLSLLALGLLVTERGLARPTRGTTADAVESTIVVQAERI